MKKTRLLALLCAILLLFTTGCSNKQISGDGEANTNQRKARVQAKPDSYTFENDAGNLLKYNLNHYANKNTTDSTLYFTLDNGLVVYNDYQYKNLWGVDVSQWQGNINWNKVAAAGITFAYIRLGYRGYVHPNLVTDTMCLKNLNNAKTAGLKVGVYFYTQAITEEEAIEEANYCVSVLGGMKLDLPIIFDAEINTTAPEARMNSISSSQWNANAVAFVNQCKALGYESGIYTNLTLEFTHFDMIDWNDEYVWYAGYDTKPITPYAFSCWQFTNKGKIDGISGQCDINLMLVRSIEG